MRLDLSHPDTDIAHCVIAFGPQTPGTNRRIAPAELHGSEHAWLRSLVYNLTFGELLDERGPPVIDLVPRPPS